MIELYTAPTTPNGHKISIALGEEKKTVQKMIQK